eukprot:4977488-Pyramimonas_sp.AAC.1
MRCNSRRGRCNLLGGLHPREFVRLGCNYFNRAPGPRDPSLSRTFLGGRNRRIGPGVRRTQNIRTIGASQDREPTGQ